MKKTNIDKHPEFIDRRPEFKIGNIRCECGEYLFDNEIVCPRCGIDIDRKSFSFKKYVPEIKEETPVIKQTPKKNIEIVLPNHIVYKKEVTDHIVYKSERDYIMSLDSKFTPFGTTDEQIRNYYKKGKYMNY